MDEKPIDYEALEDHPRTLCGLLCKRFYETDALKKLPNNAAGIRRHKSLDCFEYREKTPS